MSDYLPAFLVTEILSRLPVESLLRFRCVSKQWCSFISSPHFITTHLSHSPTPTTTPLLLLRHLSTRPKKQENYSVYLDTFSRTENNFTHVKELNFPFKTSSGNHFRVVGFCNGLFCLSDDLFGYTYTIILWNPAIRKSLTLPEPRVHFSRYGPYMFCLGFGVDLKTHDVKVVRIAYLAGANSAFTVPPEVEVYSLSTNKWKTVNSKDVHCKMVEFFYSSIDLNGSIHWVCYRKINEGRDYSNSLLVFDLGDEKFSEMSLPKILVHVSPMDLSVSLCGDKVSMIWYKKGRDRGESCDRCVVWVMNQYGKVESWTKKFVVALEGGISHAIGFRRNGEFLVEKCVGELVSYDPESKEFKDLGIHGGKETFFLSRYAESLLLLDGSNVATADPCVASGSGEVTGLVDSVRNEMELLKNWYMKTLFANCSLHH